jgi:penicillin-insensitive murein endopeptidase
MRWALAVLLAMLLLAVPVGIDLMGATTTPANGATKKKRPVKRAKAAEVPARQLFGTATTAAPLAARAIGFYARGCLAGGRALPVDGPAWQAMRLSRNRNWGHPDLVQLIERLATEARAQDGWPGLLVGDMSQPRGGPMLTGHASHQVGLDADIWLTPMPDRRLDAKEREELSATSMLAPGGLTVDPKVWTDAHVRLVRRAASYPQVARIFVHPAIKKALCAASASDSSYLRKVRPYWGHHYHMHIRMACPKASTTCESQPPLRDDDGCGKEVDDWLKLVTKPRPPVAKPPRPKPQLTLSQLPAECRGVLNAGASAQPAPGKAAPAKPADAARASSLK